MTPGRMTAPGAPPAAAASPPTASRASVASRRLGNRHRKSSLPRGGGGGVHLRPDEATAAPMTSPGSVSSGSFHTKRRASRGESSSSSSNSVLTMPFAGKRRPNGPSSKTQVPGHWVRQVFKEIGQFCACQQWETIVVVGILLILLTVFDLRPAPMLDGSTSAHPPEIFSRWYVPKFTEYLILYGGQILAILHIVYRIRNAYHTGSTVVLQVALSYLVFTFLFFGFVTSSLLRSDYRVLGDSWYIVLLLVDIPKVTILAQFVLASSEPKDVSQIVAKGMYVLAPSLLIDTFGKILLFRVFHLTNVPQLVMVAWYAFVFNLLDLLVFISLYPATLALYIELSHCEGKANRWDPKAMVAKLKRLVDNEDHSPVVHRVKVAGTASLLVIQMFWLWPLDLPPLSMGLLPNIQQFVVSNLQTMAIFAFIVGCAYVSLFSDDIEVLHSIVNFLQNKIEKNDNTGDSEENTASSYRSEEGISSSSTDEGICSTISGSNTVKAAIRPCLEDYSMSSSDWSVCSSTPFKYNNSKNNSNMNPQHNNSHLRSSQSNPQLSDLKENKASEEAEEPRPLRPLEECVKIYKADPDQMENLTDEEVIQLIDAKHIRSHALEKVLNNPLRGVEVRRKFVMKQSHVKNKNLDSVPYKDYDYEQVSGACAENVIGYMTIPLGVVGPILLDGEFYHIPMATTEGCLVASTNRGCNVLTAAGGVRSTLEDEGMTRAPILKFRDIKQAAEVKRWLETPDHFSEIKSKFDSTSRFARLKDIFAKHTGTSVYVRFRATTGDAMGMNMMSKATEHALIYLKDVFSKKGIEIEIVSLSGNMCTDKKPSAINWIMGRGKSVNCEAIIPAEIVEKTLKTTTEKLVEVNIGKNYVGSACAGSIGGNNAHAANIVTAIFIATGQDAAQVVEASNCITKMEATGNDNRDLHVTVTMPCIEVGTVGGGTILSAQGNCLDLLGVRGSHSSNPGNNARQLARIIAATVLAGELSLMAALCSGHLVSSHLRHNRSNVNMAAAQVLTTSSDQKFCAQSTDMAEKISPPNGQREMEQKRT